MRYVTLLAIILVSLSVSTAQPPKKTTAEPKSPASKRDPAPELASGFDRTKLREILNLTLDLKESKALIENEMFVVEVLREMQQLASNKAGEDVPIMVDWKSFSREEEPMIKDRRINLSFLKDSIDRPVSNLKIKELLLAIARQMHDNDTPAGQRSQLVIRDGRVVIISANAFARRFGDPEMFERISSEEQFGEDDGRETFPLLLNLNIEKEPLDAVLKSLAKKSGQNIVIAADAREAASAAVSIELEDVSLFTAVDSLCEVAGGVRPYRKGNIILIVSDKRAQTIEKQQLAELARQEAVAARLEAEATRRTREAAAGKE